MTIIHHLPYISVAGKFNSTVKNSGLVSWNQLFHRKH